MKTKTCTHIQAKVIFDSCGGTQYRPRTNLFKEDYISLKGNWTDEAVINYCMACAKKMDLKYHSIEIYKYDTDYNNETFLKVDWSE